MAKKLAALDLGTNTFHLLIAQVDPETSDLRIERGLREFVFLGRELEGEPPAFSEAGIARAMEVLKRFVEVARQAGADTLLACGTEAFRRAQNAADLIEAARHDLGLSIRVLSGAEEARLIHEGVKHGLPLPDEPYLVLDIGGGSVELIVGEKGQIRYLVSLPLGVTVLQRRFPEPDPLSPAMVETIQAYLDSVIQPAVQAVARLEVTHLIGCSGTFKTLGRLIAHQVGDSLAAQTIHGYRFGPMLFYPVYQRLLTLPLSERLRLKGMQAERAPYLPYGALLVERILRTFPISTLVVSDYALREGILYDYVASTEGGLLQEKPLRERTVVSLGEKYQLVQAHAAQTRAWAEKLFDLLRPLHHLGQTEREWLAYAAYLHDIGHFINPSGHHKHGLYILLNSPMPGFTPEELLILANLVRYHRKSLPSSEHFHYGALPRSQKKIIGLLAPLVRLADQLAKYLRHEPLRVSAGWTPTEVQIEADTTEGRAAAYLSAIYAEVQDFFERSYNRRLVLRFSWHPGSSG